MGKAGRSYDQSVPGTWHRARPCATPTCPSPSCSMELACWLTRLFPDCEPEDGVTTNGRTHRTSNALTRQAVTFCAGVSDRAALAFLDLLATPRDVRAPRFLPRPPPPFFAVRASLAPPPRPCVPCTPLVPASAFAPSLLPDLVCRLRPSSPPLPAVPSAGSSSGSDNTTTTSPPTACTSEASCMPATRSQLQTASLGTPFIAAPTCGFWEEQDLLRWPVVGRHGQRGEVTPGRARGVEDLRQRRFLWANGGRASGRARPGIHGQGVVGSASLCTASRTR